MIESLMVMSSIQLFGWLMVVSCAAVGIISLIAQYVTGMAKWSAVQRDRQRARDWMSRR